MNLRCLSATAILGLLVVSRSGIAADADTSDAFFESKIRPVLVERCYECHSAGGKQRGGLRLDTRDALRKGGDHGPTVIPGKPDESLLIKALRHLEPRMPPKGKLPEPIIADFVKWVALGAPDPRTSEAVATTKIDFAKARQFWSFQPPRKPTLPKVSAGAWPKGPIDFFILARLESERLHPVRPATRHELLRRATFDLVGLPPTPEEVEAFLADSSPDAFARVVDRLLASPHYGERWGRHWLDVARYAEDQAHTFGVKPNSNAYRYRDWVFAALNEDMPYDRFVKLQIAADLLPHDDAERVKHLPALGFFGLGAQYYKDNTEIVKAVVDELDERVDTLSRGLLGLTVACARCHDHKFDPVPTLDYYSLAGVFRSSKLADIPLATRDEMQKYQDGVRIARDAERSRNVALLQVLFAKASVFTLIDKEPKVLTPADKQQRLVQLQEEAARLRQAAPEKIDARFALVHAIAEATPADMPVYPRGNFRTPGELAPRRFLRVLAGDSPPRFTRGSGRLDLAEAIAAQDNPLTARVIVNRVWHWHFGRGIVGTPSNFGALGERPTHPELLDYLACRFVESGWSLKTLHRDIMLSATYQLSSAADERNAAIDGDNRLLWRMNRRRLDVESWRDALLFVSGRLDPATGGPTTELASTSNRRRTAYGKISRHELNGLLRLFDFPDANSTSEKRTETTVPQQQLFVLNSPFVTEQAKALAARLQTEARDDVSRVCRAHVLVLGRSADPEEVELALRYLTAADTSEEKVKNRLTRWERYSQALLGSNEFLYVD